MNLTLQFKQALRVIIMLPAAGVFLSGCQMIKPEVKESLDQAREVVAELHTVHSQNARAFELLVMNRQVEERSLTEAVFRQAEARVRAEAEQYKILAMAEFDRRAQDYLGIQFYDKIERDIQSKFAPLETRYIEALADARTNQSVLVNDPSTADQVLTAERNLKNLRCNRCGAVLAYYLALNASFVKARFTFQTEVNQTYDEPLKNFIAGLQVPTSSDAQLLKDAQMLNFQARTDGQLERLDKSYYSVDHALSDISTYLDSEATSRRFIGHAIKGFTETLVDDLKTGQLGTSGTQLTGSLENKINDFTKTLQQSTKPMQDKAQTAVVTAAGSLPPPQPPTVTAAATPAASNP